MPNYVIPVSNYPFPMVLQAQFWRQSLGTLKIWLPNVSLFWSCYDVRSPVGVHAVYVDIRCVLRTDSAQDRESRAGCRSGLRYTLGAVCGMVESWCFQSFVCISTKLTI